jgi:hypothetical protein
VAQSAGERVGDFALLDQQGVHHQLSRDAADSRAIVLFVHGLDCNISRDSLPALKQLRDQFKDRNLTFLMKAREFVTGPDVTFLMKLRQEFPNHTSAVLRIAEGVARRIDNYLVDSRDLSAIRNVRFLMINTNPQDDRDALQKAARQYGIDMPILKDETQLVGKDLQIDRTGEALLIDARTWQVVYRGPVDDRLDFEAQKPSATHHYLRDAIQALLDGRSVAGMAAPSAVGCKVSQEAKRDITYTADVAPILLEKCVGCHQAGGIAPWAMDGYDRVKGWSAMMREVLKTRRMPPWHADPAIGQFVNDRSLDTQQIRMLAQWIDAGAPRGTGPDPLAQRTAQAQAEWPLGKPDLVIDIPEQQVPAQGVFDYRYVDVRLPFDRDVWVRAVHLQPSNRAAMHHSFAFLKIPPGSGGRQIEWKEGLNAFFAAYVPGFDVLPFPEDSGQLLPKGTVIEFQLHYTALGYPTTDKPRLAIYLHQRAPSRELVVASAWNIAFRIPPQAAEYPVQARYVFDQDASLYAFFPHMHLRGSRAKYEARYPDGGSETLLSVPKYNFNWQSLYTLRTPKAIPAGTEIVFTGAFDNSRTNSANPDPSKEIRFGKQSWEEMFIGYMLYTVPNRQPTAAPPSAHAQLSPAAIATHP